MIIKMTELIDQLVAIRHLTTQQFVFVRPTVAKEP